MFIIKEKKVVYSKDQDLLDSKRLHNSMFILTSGLTARLTTLAKARIVELFRHTGDLLLKVGLLTTRQEIRIESDS